MWIQSYLGLKYFGRTEASSWLEVLIPLTSDSFLSVSDFWVLLLDSLSATFSVWSPIQIYFIEKRKLV